jgi:hypothetical protein
MGFEIIMALVSIITKKVLKQRRHLREKKRDKMKLKLSHNSV